jgi:hypothetical protein
MSQTIINDVPPYTQASASGGQTVFGTNWTANAESDVIVFVTPVGDEPNDAIQILSFPSQYSVTFVGALQQVQVTLVTPSTLGDIVTVIRMTPSDRENLYSNTNFLPSMLNNDFGILTLVDQQNQLVNQYVGPRYNYSATIIPTLDTILPILGANQFWGKNLTDTAIIAIDIEDIISGGTVTQIDTGTGLTGGPITTVGTISFAPIAANSLWANMTGGIAVPTVTPLSSLAGLILPPTSTARQMLQSQALADPVWSTATWPATTSINQILYSSANNVVSQIAGANNSVLITGVSGIPSLSTTLPQAVQTNIQYLGVQNQNLNMGGFQINSMAEPTQPSDAATKSYVDLNALTGTSAYAATTTNLTVTQSGSGVGATLTNAGVQAVFAIDGVNPPLASLVLIKNLAAPQNEGIYSVTNVGSGATNWVLTRATTFDTPAEINQTGLIIIQNGATLAGTAWFNTATIVTVDVTPFIFSQFGNIVFPVSLANGGTNASLVASAGSIVYSTPTAMAFSAVGSTGQLLRSTGATAPGWTTATYPSVAISTGSFIYANGTNFIASTSLWPNTVGLAGNIIRSNGTINNYSTATFADTYAASNLLYSNGANTVTGLTSVNSASLITNSTGVPAWSATMTNGQVIIGSTGSTPTAATLTAGTNISITNAAGSITIAASGPASNAINQVVVRTFTASGTYTPTTGMKYCTIECLGSGAGGGGTALSSAFSQGGGGGAGSYSRKTASAATIGASQVVTVGNAGTGGAAGNNNGNPGGDVSVGIICVGKGGSGGTGTPANSAGNGGLGGVAGTGDIAATGAPGMFGMGGTTNTSTPFCGQGGSSMWGAGGRYRSAASGFGAGGSGGASVSSSAADAGFDGSKGFVVITEYLSV